MPKTLSQPAKPRTSVFGRFWEPEGQMTRALAREIVKLRFSAIDEARVHELAQKNSAGKISAEELAEFDEYVELADMIAIMQSKARQVLKVAKPRPTSRG